MPSRLPFAIILMAPVLLTAQAPAQPPETATVVDPIEAVAPVPVPKVGPGAPMFTPAELREFAKSEDELSRCRAQATPVGAMPGGAAGVVNGRSRAGFRMATAAERATVEAEKLRRDAAVGKASMRQVEQAELKRQAAVRRYLGETHIDDLPDFQTEIPFVTPVDLRGEFVLEEAQNVFVLNGKVRNDRQSTVPIPELEIAMLDANGFVLANIMLAPMPAKLEPGLTKAVQYRMPGAPMAAATARIAYAPKESLDAEGWKRFRLCGHGPRSQLRGVVERDRRIFVMELKIQQTKPGPPTGVNTGVGR